MQNGAMPEKVEALQERLVLELSERMIYTGKRFTDSFSIVSRNIYLDGVGKKGVELNSKTTRSAQRIFASRHDFLCLPRVHAKRR